MIILKIIGLYIFLGLWYVVIDSKMINIYIESAKLTALGYSQLEINLYQSIVTINWKFMTARYVASIIFFPIIMSVIAYHLVKIAKKK